MRRYSPDEAMKIIQAAGPAALPDEAGLRRIAAEFGIPEEKALSQPAAFDPPRAEVDFWGRGSGLDPAFPSALPAAEALRSASFLTGLALDARGRLGGRWLGSQIVIDAVDRSGGSLLFLRLPRRAQWLPRLIAAVLAALPTMVLVGALAPFLKNNALTPFLLWAGASVLACSGVSRWEARRFTRIAASLHAVITGQRLIPLAASPLAPDQS